MKRRIRGCYNLAMVIDFHTHIFPLQIGSERGMYAAKDPCFGALYSSEKAKLATVEDVIESMDRDGVDVSVVMNIGWSTSELCRETNDYIMESVSRYPGRLEGFCSVQPMETDEAVKEIERCAKGGLKGIGELRPDTQQIDFSDEYAMGPFTEAVKKYGMVLLFHASEPVGHLYPGKGVVTPEILYPFIAANPDIDIVLGHWGGGLPFYAMMPEVKKAMARVYFDAAASPFLYRPQVYEEVSRLVGGEHVLFGSDFPLMPQSRLINEIRASSLTEEEKELVLGGNARRLLDI